MKKLPAKKTSASQGRFSFHGVAVRINQVFEGTAAWRDPGHMRAYSAWREMECFDEESQLMLTRRFQPYFHHYLKSELAWKDSAASSLTLKCLAPRTREILSQGNSEELLVNMPPYWSPEQRVAWLNYLSTPTPKKLRNRMVKFRGVTIDDGRAYMHRTNKKALRRLAKPNETVYETALRVARLAARELKAA